MVAGAQSEQSMEEQMKEWVQAADVKLRSVEATQQNTLAKLAEYEKVQNEWKTNLAQQVTFEIGKVTGGIGELYKKVELMLRMFDARLKDVEREGKQSSKDCSKSLLVAKDMKPPVLDKEDQWRRWKSDIEDYCEEVFPGMKEMLEKVRESDITVDEPWFDGASAAWWQRGDTLFRFLKRYTGTEARRVVLGVPEDNGWEAWRRLHQQFEPATVTREAQVLSRYTNMVTKKARNPRETKTLLNELSERAKRVEEVIGKPIEDRHAMSVIAGILDPETSKHTAQYQGAKASVEVLKRKVMEFINLVTASESAKMDLDRVQQCDYEGEWDGEDWESERTQEELNAFGDKCHVCGGVGHYARECPTKKGKGKGALGKGAKGEGKNGKGKAQKGDGKGGKGKGKGKNAAPIYGGCWTCGGAHFSKDCPKNSARGAGDGNNDLKVLCCLREVLGRSAVTTRNRFQALSDEPEWADEQADQGSRPDGAGAESMTGRINRRWGPHRAQRAAPMPAPSVRGREAGAFTPTAPRKNFCSFASTTGRLSTFVEVIKGRICSVEGEEEWEEIELAVDSGATETVVGTDMLTNVQTVEGDTCKRRAV